MIPVSLRIIAIALGLAALAAGPSAQQAQAQIAQQIQGVDNLASVATNVGGAADALTSVAA